MIWEITELMMCTRGNYEIDDNKQMMCIKGHEEVGDKRLCMRGINETRNLRP
jgi:hypothetical protein